MKEEHRYHRDVYCAGRPGQRQLVQLANVPIWRRLAAPNGVRPKQYTHI